MSRLLMTCAAIALLTAPAAHASMRIGGSLAASSQAAAFESERPSFLEVIREALSLRLFVTAAAPVAGQTADAHNGATQCDKAEDRAEHESAEKEAKNTVGPEPVYLAF